MDMRGDIDNGLKEGMTPEEVQKASQVRREKSSGLFRALAGGYLCYLAYDIIKGLLNTAPQDQEGPAWVMWLAAVVFAAVGAWLVIDYCIKYYKEYNKSKEE